MEKKRLPVSFKLSLLLFFISIQCLLAAIYLRERENYYKLEAQLTGPAQPVQNSVAGSGSSDIVNALPEKAASDEIHYAPGTAVPGMDLSAPFEQAAPPAQPLLIDTAQPKKDGTLWFDKQNDSYVVTIGKKNGVKEGDILKIYDSDQTIGSARVTRPMEKISMVEINDADRQNLTKAYYKVVLE